MRKVPYLDWENILLDTTAIFAYIQATRETNTDPRCDFVKRLIDDLNTKKTTSGKRRTFYISAISIAEMYDRSTDQKKTERIVQKLRINGLNFVPFDTDVAEHMTHNYHPVLGTDKQKQITKELNLPGEGTIAREWVTKDLMIIATADYYKCDTAITLDARTFEPLAKRVNYHCCVALEPKFNLNTEYIFEYNG